MAKSTKKEGLLRRWLKEHHGARQVLKGLIALPMILGIVGLMQEGNSFLNAAFKCVTMYALNYGEDPGNIFTELARWSAPVATASGLVLVLAAVNKRFHNWLARRSGESVAVFGPEEEKNPILEELGWKGINLTNGYIKAHQYILLGEENENLEFYQRHYDKLKNKRVYIKCSSLPGQSSNDPKLHLLCQEETASRIFWKKYCPYELSVANGHRLKIAILGFDKLGQELLLSGLQYNIFHPKQSIEYHVFGQDAGFVQTHWQLHNISDPVIFHTRPWYAELPLLRETHMAIVVQQEQQLSLLNQLQLALPERQFHVLAAEMNGVMLLDRMIPFEWKKETSGLEFIMRTRRDELAKRLNLHYAALYAPEDAPVLEIDENLDKEWEKLNTFTRYSNISAAEYYDVCARIMGGAEPTEEMKILLSELEHIRWCRYHYLNNWVLGVPASGKAKDVIKRIHKALIPYDQLAPEEQMKDWNNVELLMKLNAKMNDQMN